VLIEFVAHVSLHRLLPETAAAVLGNQTKSRIGSTHRDAIATGKQMRDGCNRTLDVLNGALTSPIPDENELFPTGGVFSAAIEPFAVRRPGDATKISFVQAFGISCIAPLEGRCVVNLDSNAIIEADGDAVARGVDGHGARLLTSTRNN